ncbi:MAG: recombination mediator RecR [Pseudomonadales bacterium]|jgi:recombination protein RecR|nr:recombination mediator RecR [Pseudomonadales bacterium]
MQKLPKAVVRLTEKFERLPGIGPKSAQRLVFYLLHNPEKELEDFAQKLVALKRETCLCSECHQITSDDPCSICSDSTRDGKLMCVVEQPLDLLALERSEKYNGKYHVLHGCIDPLNRIGPEELYLKDIKKRLEGVEELILATNPTLEGEATAMYITKMIEADENLRSKIKITRIGHGLPIGADIEYADGVTLARALEGRREV